MLKAFRPLTLTFSALWGVCMLILIVNLNNPPRWVAWISLSYALYHGLLTIWLWWRRRSTSSYASAM